MRRAFFTFLLGGLGVLMLARHLSAGDPPRAEDLLTIPPGETLEVPWLPTETPTATATPTPDDSTPTPALPEFVVFPDPAHGDHATFRFQSPDEFNYRIDLLDRFGGPMTQLTGVGQGMVEVVWTLAEVPEGLYYYSVTAFHPATGTLLKYPVGRLAVEKDPTPTPVPRPHPKRTRHR